MLSGEGAGLGAPPLKLGARGCALLRSSNPCEQAYTWASEGAHQVTR